MEYQSAGSSLSLTHQVAAEGIRTGCIGPPPKSPRCSNRRRADREGLEVEVHLIIASQEIRILKPLAMTLPMEPTWGGCHFSSDCALSLHARPGGAATLTADRA
jgi:hypothetical protein